MKLHLKNTFAHIRESVILHLAYSKTYYSVQREFGQNFYTLRVRSEVLTYLCVCHTDDLNRGNTIEESSQ